MSSARDAGEGGRDEAADAALIDRLYGERELDGDAVDADADAALRSLRSMRTLIARVRDEAPAVEPAQAVSARLLLAAAEHAPRRAVVAVAAPAGGGLLARLRRWFAPLASHPGLAAAATLVVVVGVGSALYVRGKGQPAEPVRDEVARTQAAAPTAPAGELEDGKAAAPGMLDGDGMAPGGQGTTAGSGSRDGMILEGQLAPATPTESAGGRRDRGPAADPARPAQKPAPAPAFEPEKRDKRAKNEAAKGGAASGAGASGGETVNEESDDEVTSAQEAAPPPPPASTRDLAEEKVDPDVGQAPVTVVTKEPVQPRKPARAKKAKQPSAADEARALATRAYAAAKAGRCGEMEQLATEVRGLDAGYYDATFAKQADVVKCRARK